MTDAFQFLPESASFASCADKPAILTELARQFAAVYGQDEGAVLEALEDRERLGSTGFGRRVAMPHARIDTVDGPVAILLRLDRDVDFTAADGAPVRLVMGLLSPHDDGSRHLRALAAMSRTTRDERKLQQLFDAEGEEELYAIFANTGLRDAA